MPLTIAELGPCIKHCMHVTYIFHPAMYVYLDRGIARTSCMNGLEVPSIVKEVDLVVL